MKHHHHTFLQRLEDVAVRPISGLILAALILFIAFWIVRGIGEGLINLVFDPIFETGLKPLVLILSPLLRPGSFVHDIIIGKLINGDVDFMQSFGLLTTGIYIPVAAVLPYVLAFYLVLGFLEDFGYLPRLAVLLDKLLHKVGLHGYAIIPNMLGLGCNIPAILSTRILDSKRERFIAITLISIGVPCAALQAMILGILGEKGIGYVVLVYVALFIIWMVTGFFMNLFVKGFSPELIMEVPPLRLPTLKNYFKKFWIRLYMFFKEAIPIVLAGVLAATVLYYFGAFQWIAGVTAPVVKGIWGLPPDAITAIAVGFLRKDVAVGLFEPLALTTKQLVVGCTVLATFFPCIASFVVIMKELGVKYLIFSSLVMIVVSIVAGGLMNLMLGLVM